MSQRQSQHYLTHALLTRAHKTFIYNEERDTFRGLQLGKRAPRHSFALLYFPPRRVASRRVARYSIPPLSSVPRLLFVFVAPSCSVCMRARARVCVCVCVYTQGARDPRAVRARRCDAAAASHRDAVIEESLIPMTRRRSQGGWGTMRRHDGWIRKSSKPTRKKIHLARRSESRATSSAASFRKLVLFFRFGLGAKLRFLGMDA